MLRRIIEGSANNPFLVGLATIVLIATGVYAARNTPLDAIPDLSDVQVIVFTEYPGQAPQVVEDQVTYPLTTAMLSVPFAKTVRGYSFFGFSFVYIIFEDGTDLYWARSRVLEYLNFVAGRLPPGVTPALGPDATGVGWIYEYALVDRTGKHDLAELRSIQDWYLRYELQTVPGVAEVAGIGGFIRQYQVEVEPNALASYGFSLSQIRQAIQRSNNDVGGRLVEMAETEFMVRGRGYIRSLDDLRSIVIGTNGTGTPVLLRDVAKVHFGPELRRGLADLNGEGEVAAGIVIMRFGENALDVIRNVKARLETLKAGLPEGVEIVTVYDRSALIERAVDNLREKLVEEIAIVALICVLFLVHLRSAFVAILTLPLGVMVSIIIMYGQGINANIMSLGGIAIAIGAMVDAAVVMVENAHKHLERDEGKKPRKQIMIDAATEVGPALFFSLLIITVSFLPVFTLEAQEGRLFQPLAFTKTYSMAGAAVLAITVVPVLMIWFIRGRIVPESRNPLNRLLLWLYAPVIHFVLRRRILVLTAAGLLLVATVLYPLPRLGSEFMPPLNEGDLLYMPTTLPGVSITKAREILQQTDRMIRKIPEVHHVFGKVGRADTATDPAPLSMIETTIMLKPPEEWREGMTIKKLIAELEESVKLPGVTNAWTMPIKTRIDMLATGIKTPVGIKIAGPDLMKLQELGQEVEGILADEPGTLSIFAERVVGGNYLDFDIDRHEIARYGLTIADVQDVIQSAIGGMNVTWTVEGLERYPVNVRYSRELRDNLAMLRRVLVPTPSGAQVPLSQLAKLEIRKGPPSIKSENARLNAWIYVDLDGVDVGTWVNRAKKTLEREFELPPGYSIAWSGQYEYMERAAERLRIVVPITLGAIFLLLYLNFRRLSDALIVMLTLPLASIGGVWLLWWLDYDLSVAVGVGFIALAGVAAELGVILLVFLEEAVSRFEEEGRLNDRRDLREAVREGAGLRVRPIMMTVVSTIVGLLPIMWGTGSGSETMRRIAAPMVGGLVSATILTLIVIPVTFALVRGWNLPSGDERGEPAETRP
ncbi:MAG TPA: efflux RND transporter permease subunit [Deltaproteobacteria bacterium]|nr:efflux RND transporter permease subunit [Deltaproteobacteria bacterium]